MDAFVFIVVVWLGASVGFVLGAIFNAGAYERGYRDARAELLEPRTDDEDGDDEKVDTRAWEPIP